MASKKLKSFFKKVFEFQNHWIYFPLIGFLVFLDVFIMLVPTESILIVTSALKPKKAVFTAFWLTFCSLLGGLLFCTVIQHYGIEYLQKYYPVITQSPSWFKARAFIEHYGFLGVFLMIFGPMPQPGTLAIGVLLGMSIPKILLAVLSARLPKYLFFAWIGMKAPHLYKKIFKEDLPISKD